MAAGIVGGRAYVGAKAGEPRRDERGKPSRRRKSDQDAPLEAAWVERGSLQPVQASAAPAQGDLASGIVELKGLNDQGVLTDEEFAAAKQKLIDES